MGLVDLLAREAEVPDGRGGSVPVWNTARIAALRGDLAPLLRHIVLVRELALGRLAVTCVSTNVRQNETLASAV